MTQNRFQQAEIAAWVSIAGNMLLAVMKGAAGYFGGSKALIADAAHSASDAVGTFALLAGQKAAKSRHDDDSVYKHGKAQSVSAILVSVLLLLVGLETGISSVKTMYDGVSKQPEKYALIVIVLSLIVKEAMYRYKYRRGALFGSQAVNTSSWERRSDVYSSLVAVAGVGGAMLGSYLGIAAMMYLDPLAGVVISAMVLRMGFSLIMESVRRMDHVLPQEDADELLQTVQRVKGVIAVDELSAREHGHYVIVDITISVNPKITVMEGNEIAKIVKYTLMKRFIHVSDVAIHVNPYDPGYPYKHNADTELNAPTLLH